MLPYPDRMLLTHLFSGLQANGIQLAPETVDEVMKMLDQKASSMTLSQGNVTEVGHGSFGDSPTGAYRLATNASMAHQALITEITNMVSGLRAYRSAVEAWAQGLTAVDNDTTSFNATVEAATDCVTKPQVANQCTVPTGTDS